MIFLDTETHLFGPFNRAPRIVCTAHATESDPGDLTTGSGDFARVVNSGAAWCGHNIAYDNACLLAERFNLAPAVFKAYRENRVEDTMVRQWLLDIAAGCFPRSYGLADLSQRILDRPMSKGADTWRMRYSELDGVPLDQWPAAAVSYPIGDVDTTRAVWEAQEDYPHWLVDQYRQTRAHFALHLTSVWGLRPDPDKVDAWERTLRAEEQALRATAIGAGLVRAKDGSRDLAAIRARVVRAYEAKGERVPTTEKGAVKTSDEVCRNSGDHVLESIGRLGQVIPLLSKDLPILRSPRVHTRFWITANGRSASQDPNVQNNGRKGGVRECFGPSHPGLVYVCADFGQLELVTWAQVCLDILGESELARVLNAGEDPHLAMAGELLGISYAEALRRYKDGDKVVSEKRQFAKIPNFGLPGGLGVASFIAHARKNGHDLTVQQAQDVRDAWFRRWPESRLYFAHINSLTRFPGATITQLRSGRIRGDVGFTDGANTFFSGLGADAAKEALFDVVEACYTNPDSPLWGARPVNFVHDEINLETTEARAADAAEELSRLMVTAAQRWVPDVRITAEPLVTRVLSKAAKPVRVNGRLVPWESPDKR